MLRVNHMVNSQAYNLDYIFQALSDPTRRSILKSLARKERGIKEVADSYSISLAAISKHVKVLELHDSSSGDVKAVFLI
jgi:predicted transcriptional regulator